MLMEHQVPLERTGEQEACAKKIQTLGSSFAFLGSFRVDIPPLGYQSMSPLPPLALPSLSL